MGKICSVDTQVELVESFFSRVGRTEYIIFRFCFSSSVSSFLSYIYIYCSCIWYICIYMVPCPVLPTPPPPPPMVWVQNLRFGYICMEPAKTRGIYNVLTSSASETVVFAAFCNTTLYTTTLIIVLLLLLLLLLRLRINPHSKSPPPPLPQGGGGGNNLDTT